MTTVAPRRCSCTPGSPLRNIQYRLSFHLTDIVFRSIIRRQCAKIAFSFADREDDSPSLQRGERGMKPLETIRYACGECHIVFDLCLAPFAEWADGDMPHPVDHETAAAPFCGS